MGVVVVVVVGVVVMTRDWRDLATALLCERNLVRSVATS